MILKSIELNGQAIVGVASTNVNGFGSELLFSSDIWLKKIQSSLWLLDGGNLPVDFDLAYFQISNSLGTNGIINASDFVGTVGSVNNYRLADGTFSAPRNQWTPNFKSFGFASWVIDFPEPILYKVLNPQTNPFNYRIEIFNRLAIPINIAIWNNTNLFYYQK